MNKKAIGPVVATSLLIVVVVAAVVGFQAWFNTYQSGMNVNVEQESQNSFNSGIQKVLDNIIYYNNGANENLPIKAIKIGKYDCNISFNASPGISQIDISSCLENSSVENIDDVVIVTNNGIESEVVNFGSPIFTGYFIDNAVEGIYYNSGSFSGYTGPNGEYTYKRGENVEFILGNVSLGKSKAKKFVTPLDLANTSNVDDVKVLNIVKLLTSFDVDSNPENGIQINSTVRDKFKTKSLNFSKNETSFDLDLTPIANNLSVTIRNSTFAKEHLNNSINNIVKAENYEKISKKLGSYTFIGTVDNVQYFYGGSSPYYDLFKYENGKMINIGTCYQCNIDIIDNNIFLSSYDSGNYYFSVIDSDGLRVLNNTLFGVNASYSHIEPSNSGYYVVVKDLVSKKLIHFSTSRTPIVQNIMNLSYNQADDIKAFGNSLYIFDADSLYVTAFGSVMFVKEINPSSNVSTSFLFANENGVVFLGNDGVNGNELWRSDGTTNGTYMLKDINPSGSIYVSRTTGIVQFLGDYYFRLDDGINGAELWRSDGTTNGTYMLKDINPLGNGVGALDLTGKNNPILNNLLFFGGNDGINGNELWRSDGTTEGTYMLKDINPSGNGIYYGMGLPFARTALRSMVFEDKLYFSTYEDGKNYVWVTDGTTEGTKKVMKEGFYFIYNFEIIDNKLFISARKESSDLLDLYQIIDNPYYFLN